MKTRKLLAVMATGVLATSLLVACSSNQSNSNQVQSVDEAKTVSFMQLANENTERIWYIVDDSNEDGQISKDDEIRSVLIVKNGNADHYFLVDTTLADIKDKTDEEIVELVKDLDKKNFDEEKTKKIQSLTESISSTEEYIKEMEISLNEKTDKTDENAVSWHETEIASSTEQLESAKSNLSEIESLNYQDIKSQYSDYTIRAVVETDASGNNVATEELKLKGYTNLTDVYNISLELQYQVNGDIYNQTYTGYSLDRERFLISNSESLGNNVSLGFDTLDTKNVTEE